MKALFFGESSRQLFGAYHAPRGDAARDSGVVLCYPSPHEYNSAHWAFRKLAGMLAREGFHVLRFDYRGTGDSAGETEDGEPKVWIQDLRAAVTELRDLAGVRSVSLVGLRLGAALATRACAEGLSVRDLILWEPVVSGADYLAELNDIDWRRNLMLLHPRPRSSSPGELMGFPLTPELRRGLEEIDMRRTAQLAARRVLIVAPNDLPQYQQLREALSKITKADVQLRIVPDEAAAPAMERATALLSNQILVAITETLARKAAA